MVMDCLRSCYQSHMRLYPDDPERLTLGRWRWCPEGALALPFAHAFGSVTGDPEKWQRNYPLGEVYGIAGRSKGTASIRFTGRRFCGKQALWQQGSPLELEGTPLVDAEGVPLCCQEAVAIGGLMADGVAVFQSGYGAASFGGALGGGVSTPLGDYRYYATRGALTAGASGSGFGYVGRGLGGALAGGMATAEIGGDDVIPGTIIAYAGSGTPDGYLECDGSSQAQATWPDLYDAIGLTWGDGGGGANFSLPDLRGRAGIGAGEGDGLTPRTLAETGGEEDHTLVVGEMPNHQHSAGYANVDVEDTTPTDTFRQVTDWDGSNEAGTQDIGGDGPHNNMQPFAVVRYLIKT